MNGDSQPQGSSGNLSPVSGPDKVGQPVASPAEPAPSPTVHASPPPVTQAPLSAATPMVSPQPAPTAMPSLDALAGSAQPSLSSSPDAAIGMVPEQTASYIDDHDDLDGRPSTRLPQIEPFAWSAAVNARQRPKSWFATLMFGALAIAVLIFIVTKQLVSSIAIIVLAGLTSVVYGKKPYALNYSIDGHGITIGIKRYEFDEFKAFSIIEEHGFNNVALVPFKRFSPLLTIYYDPHIEKQIIEAISAHLPIQQYKRDAIDVITGNIHF